MGKQKSKFLRGKRIDPAIAALIYKENALRVLGVSR